MAESSADVVIVGGGIAGMTTAYYLAKSGVPSVVVERDAIGSHASGFAYGGLSPLSGFGIPGPLAEIAQDGMQLHRELSKSLLAETGIDVDFRVRSSLALAFTEADVQRLRATLPWQQQQPGYAVRWLDVAEARRVEPRIADETLGATLVEGGGAVEPYRLVLALTRAAERLGVRVRHGRAIGLRRDGGRVTGVVLEREVLSCATAELAHQTACLRPVASDGLLVLGCVPGLDQVYVATGGARKGILYGPVIGHAIADLVLGRDTRVALDAFAPGRFARDRRETR